MSEPERPYKRLSPLTPLVRSFLLVVAVFASTWDDLLRGDLGPVAWLLLALLVSGAVYGAASWLRTKYWIEADELRVDTGVVSRQSRRIRVDRLQGIDISQPFVARLFGLAELKMDVAGGGSGRGRWRSCGSGRPRTCAPRCWPAATRSGRAAPTPGPPPGPPPGRRGRDGTGRGRPAAGPGAGLARPGDARGQPAAVGGVRGVPGLDARVRRAVRVVRADRRRAGRRRAAARRPRGDAVPQAVGLLPVHGRPRRPPGSRCGAACSSSTRRRSRCPASRAWWSPSRCCGAGWAGPRSTSRSRATRAGDGDGKPSASTVMPVAPRATALWLARRLLEEAGSPDPDAVALTPAAGAGPLGGPGAPPLPALRAWGSTSWSAARAC